VLKSNDDSDKRESCEREKKRTDIRTDGLEFCSVFLIRIGQISPYVRIVFQNLLLKIYSIMHINYYKDFQSQSFIDVLFKSYTV